MSDQLIGLATTANELAQRTAHYRREYDCGEATDLSKLVEDLANVVSNLALALNGNAVVALPQRSA